MTLDCDKYRARFNDIKGLFREIDHSSPKKEIQDALSMAAIASHVPIIIICYYFAEINGLNPFMKDLIASLRSFYGITSVINSKVD